MGKTALSNLPYHWFDSAWLSWYELELLKLFLPVRFLRRLYLKFHPKGLNAFFEGTLRNINFNNYYNGVFCFHWHNNWEKHIHEQSPFYKLNKIIDKNLKNNTSLNR